MAGESSGDDLGAGLIRAIRAQCPGARFRGIGGTAMQGEGLASLFPMSDIAVMGFIPVLQNLRRLLARIAMAAKAVIDEPPDVLVIIDSPDFTHRVARRVRAACPWVPIIDYVSPTVWAWRPGRARKMRPYVDHLLALLPFEPDAHKALGGPDCTYVGHPLTERLDLLRRPQAEPDKPSEAPQMLVLPGSRRSEVQRLMPVFGEAAGLVAQAAPGVKFVLPAVAHLAEVIEAAVAQWPVDVRIVTGEAEKYAAMRTARAALAASGTVTLELALAMVPTVLAYKVSRLEEAIARRLIVTPFAGLPNIIAGREVIPEFLQERADGAHLSDALIPLIKGGVEREAQLQGFADIAEKMLLPEGASPSSLAAGIVLQHARQGRGGYVPKGC
ncbi:MAG: lipid-A-disaccharide synthase [Hyphomicrobiales bacterium]|nr:lipid-A-disaccharide synthase [Hyphomicrobiales bacterium]